MSLAALRDRDIYNPLAKKKELKPPLQDWKESVPVILLSEYLKMKSDAGINLRQNDGLPCLCFDPGSRSVQIVEEVRVLFEDAMFDLIELINSGKIELPLYDSQSQCKTSGAVTNEAGPSAGSRSLRVAKPQ